MDMIRDGIVPRVRKMATILAGEAVSSRLPSMPVHSHTGRRSRVVEARWSSLCTNALFASSWDIWPGPVPAEGPTRERYAGRCSVNKCV
jgi:hypothetical protein